MLTNNAINAMTSNLFHDVSYPRTKLPVKLVDGTTWYITRGDWPLDKSLDYKNTYNSVGVVLGSGDSAPAVTDYRLDTLLTYTGSELRVTRTIVNGISEGKAYLYVDLFLTNLTANPITIREIGWMGDVQAYSTQGTSSSMTKHVLMDRTVLDNPVTVVPGTPATIRYKISMPIP